MKDNKEIFKISVFFFYFSPLECQVNLVIKVVLMTKLNLNREDDKLIKKGNSL